MRQLTKLLLEKNRIVELTENIGNLSMLKVLHMPDNLLEHLPAEIGQLFNLVMLELSYNWLVDLPCGANLLQSSLFLP